MIKATIKKNLKKFFDVCFISDQQDSVVGVISDSLVK